MASTAEEDVIASTRKPFIFISYSWDKTTDEDVRKVAKHLESSGLFRTVSIDINFMDLAPVDTQMAENVANADVVLIFFNNYYQTRPNCRKEAILADKYAKKKIFIKMVKDCDTKMESWFDPIILNNIYLDYYKTKDPLDKILKGVMSKLDEQVEAAYVSYNPTNLAILLCSFDFWKERYILKELASIFEEFAGASNQNSAVKRASKILQENRLARLFKTPAIGDVDSAIGNYMQNLLKEKLAICRGKPDLLTCSSNEILDIFDVFVASLRRRNNNSQPADVELRDGVKALLLVISAYNMTITDNDYIYDYSNTVIPLILSSLQIVGQYMCVHPSEPDVILAGKMSNFIRYSGISGKIFELVSEEEVSAGSNVNAMNHTKAWPMIVFGKRLDRLRGNMDAALAAASATYRGLPDKSMRRRQFAEEFCKYQRLVLITAGALDNMYAKSGQTSNKKSGILRDHLRALSFPIAALHLYIESGGPTVTYDDFEASARLIKDRILELLQSSNNILKDHYEPIYEIYDSHRNRSLIAILVLGLVFFLAGIIAVGVARSGAMDDCGNCCTDCAQVADVGQHIIVHHDAASLAAPTHTTINLSSFRDTLTASGPNVDIHLGATTITTDASGDVSIGENGVTIINIGPDGSMLRIGDQVSHLAGTDFSIDLSGRNATVTAGAFRLSTGNAINEAKQIAGSNNVLREAFTVGAAGGAATGGVAVGVASRGIHAATEPKINKGILDNNKTSTAESVSEPVANRFRKELVVPADSSMKSQTDKEHLLLHH